MATMFPSLNPLVGCCYPADNDEKSIVLCLKLETDTECYYMSACTQQTHGIPCNGEPTVLPLAEFKFFADDGVKMAMDKTMACGLSIQPPSHHSRRIFPL